MAYKMKGSKFYGMGNSSPAKHGTTDDFLYGRNGHNPDIMEGKHEDWHTDKIEAEKKKPSPNKQKVKIKDPRPKKDNLAYLEGVDPFNKGEMALARYKKDKQRADLKKRREGTKKMLNWVDEQNSKKFRGMMDKHMGVDPSKEIKIKKK
tara:strand:+ start:174 stop:620 length:447 start_codon:yes stop_codon:yes gene_type:complete